MAFWHALRSMVTLGGMIFFGVLLYSIFAVHLIGRNEAFDDVTIEGDTVYDRFGTVARSMYSLFELMTLEGWVQVARPLVRVQPLIFLFIASYIMIFTFGLLNMVVATVVEKTLDQTRQVGEIKAKEAKRQMLTELMQMKSAFQDSDSDHNGELTMQEFVIALDTNPALRGALEELNLDMSDISEVFRVLDWDGSRSLTMEEFVNACAKLQNDVASAWDAMATHASVRSLERNLGRLDEKVTRIDDRLDRQEKLLLGLARDLSGHLNVSASSSSPAQPECCSPKPVLLADLPLVR